MTTKRSRSSTPDDLPKDFPRSPISIPEGESGDVKIVHSKENCFDVVSMREAFTTGRRPMRVTLTEPITIHRLLENDSVWMSDLPIEVRQMGDAIKAIKPMGRVLVGGLGLGVLATMIARRRNVDKVVVVEINEDIIRLVGSYLPKKCEVLQGDVLEYVKGLGEWMYDYDSVLIDTWRGTSEGTWWGEVFPLRRAIASLYGEEVIRRTHFWAEDIMLGQIVNHLTMRMALMFDPKAHEQWRPHWYYRMEKPILDIDEAVEFVRGVGLPWWEEKYGYLYPIGEAIK